MSTRVSSGQDQEQPSTFAGRVPERIRSTGLGSGYPGRKPVRSCRPCLAKGVEPSPIDATARQRTPRGSFMHICGCARNRPPSAENDGSPPSRRAPEWRWGESNPRPMRFQRRHLRAQPTASFRNRETLSARTSRSYPESGLTRRSRNPDGSTLHCVARIRRGRDPPGGQAASC